jgi:hypothetical protein
MTFLTGHLTEIAEPRTISALEFDVLWEHLRLKSLPLVLKVPSPGRTHSERAKLVQDAWAGLADRGLGEGVSPDPALAAQLAVLDRPDRELDARLWLGRSVRVLVAQKGGAAVLAVLDNGSLTLREASPDGLPRDVLTPLPTAPAGPGGSVTMPSAVIEDAARDARNLREFETALRNHGVREAAAVAAMISSPVRQGQFGAAVRDNYGRRHRADRVVGFFDTPAGRYLQLRRAEPGAESWSTISPCDHRRLLHHVTELLDEVSGPPD